MLNGEKKWEHEYNGLWSTPKKIKREDEKLLLGWHFGYYEKGIRTKKEAFMKMNEYVGRLLDIQKKNVRILDAGCGVGSTVIYLAQRYPHSSFFGIALAANEITQAETLKSRLNLHNTYFSQQSYNKTDFPDMFFDDIYALESVCHAEDDTIFLQEMKRLLKPDGKLAIIDVLARKNCTSSYMKNIRKKILRERDFNTPERTIDSFEESLEKEGFKDINIHDLKKTKHIRNLTFLFCLLLFRSLLFNVQEKMKTKTRNVFSLAGALLTQFIFSSLICIHLRFSYYSITAVKP